MKTINEFGKNQFGKSVHWIFFYWLQLHIIVHKNWTHSVSVQKPGRLEMGIKLSRSVLVL